MKTRSQTSAELVEMIVWVITGDSMPAKVIMKVTADIDDLSWKLSKNQFFGEPKDIVKANYNVKLCDGTIVKRNVKIFDLPSNYDNPLKIEIDGHQLIFTPFKL
jgi:hypothetical protein